jgi:hypothetical protein
MAFASFAALRRFALASLLALTPALAGCGDESGSNSDDIVDVPHTDVERQSIGNCWLYAEATWAESMHLAATGEKFDVSQSYWTYWHWYGQILQEGVSTIGTGGSFLEANLIILERGLMPESKFVPDDTVSEMSSRQSSALAAVNKELATGRLATAAARSDAALVRKVLDESWKLSSTIKGQLTKAFGKDGKRTLLTGGLTKGTGIIAATAFDVQYTERRSNPSQGTLKNTTLDVAMDEWTEVSYPSWSSITSTQRRDFQIRIQRALHDAQPVIVTWDVDFNAMEGSDPATRGSFNMTTLKRLGPGHQGIHMTVMEDYEVFTKEFGLLKAGVTLDPANANDKKKLDAALLRTSEVKFFRIKNSWGALRDDRTAAPGFPGYHDLYLDYLNGPIQFCPSVEGAKNSTNCKTTSVPLREVALPPGY